MEVRLLGPVRLSAGGRLVDLGPRQQRFVLAVLALEANRMVPVERIIELTWPVRVPRTAGHAIQVRISQLRSVLATVSRDGQQVEIGTSGAGYVLRVDPDCVDAHRFQALTEAAATTTDDERKIAVLTEALDLWSGPALADTAPPEIRERLCSGLHEAQVTAIEDRLDAQLRLGRHRAVLADLADLIQAYPGRDRLVEQLMLALYRDGQAREALDVYRRVRTRLAEELGLDPGPQLRRLELAILRSDPALDLGRDWTEPGTASAPPPSTPRELPPDVYAFTGREAEQARLDDVLLAETPAAAIAVVVGAGGVGKTALAVHWAHRRTPHFPDGQLYLDLRGAHPGEPLTPDQALAALLGSLGVNGADLPTDLDARTARYRSLLAGRRVLILLDNAQDVEQVRPLVPGTPSGKVLVTSRHDLAGLVARDGARRTRLSVLRPEEALLLVRTLVGERADDEPEAALALARHCAHLPLALRVAAELVVARPAARLADLAEELANEGHRLDLLDAAADRGTALRAVFFWSERHLPAAATRLFWLLGLHPGRDVDVHAAAALADVDGAEAGRLADLLCRGHLVDPAGVGRWRMHDLLHEYARERAAAELETADRRAALDRLQEFYLVRAAQANDAAFPGAGEAPAVFANAADALAWLDAERLNLVATAQAADGLEYPVAMARAIRRYLQVGYHNADAFALSRHALDLATATGDQAGQAMALLELGKAYARTGSYAEAIGWYRSALELYRGLGDRAGEADCRHYVGVAGFRLGRYPTALAEYHEALRLRRETGDRVGQARALGDIGQLLWSRGEHLEAKRRYEEAAAIFHEVGDKVGQGRALNDLGNLYQRQGRYTEAHECHERALAVLREVGDRAAEACALIDLGRIYSKTSLHDLALDHHEQALRTFRDIGDRVGEAEVLVDLGEAYERMARWSEALDNHRHAHTIAVEVGDRLFQANALNGQGRSLSAQQRPAEALARHQAAQTLALDIGDRYCLARSLDGIARAHEVAGRLGEAREYWAEALSIYTELDLPEAESIRTLLSA